MTRSTTFHTRDGRTASNVRSHPQSAESLLGHVEGFGPCSWSGSGTYYATDSRTQHPLDLIDYDDGKEHPA